MTDPSTTSRRLRKVSCPRCEGPTIQSWIDLNNMCPRCITKVRSAATQPREDRKDHNI